MSMEQLVWADNKRTGDPRLKLILLLLADSSACFARLCTRTEMGAAELQACLQRLEDMELIVKIEKDHTTEDHFYLAVDTFGRSTTEQEIRRQYAHELANN